MTLPQNSESSIEVPCESGKRYYVAAYLCIFFWGTTYAISKKITPDPLNTLSFSTLRTSIGFLFLLIYLIFSGQLKNFTTFFKTNYKKIALLSFGCYCGAYLIQYWAISMTSATHQTIIGTTQTYWVLFFNLIFLKKKSSKSFLIGALLATTGVFIVILSKNKTDSGSNPILGDLLSLIAFAIWGVYTFIGKKVFQDQPSSLTSISVIFCSLLFLLPMSFIFGIQSEITQLTPSQWGYMLWLGIASTGLAYLFYNYALSSDKLGAENVVVVNMLQPIIGIITSIIILDETITWHIIIGLILVLSGLYLSSKHNEDTFKEACEDNSDSSK